MTINLPARYEVDPPHRGFAVASEYEFDDDFEDHLRLDLIRRGIIDETTPSR